MKSIIFFLPVFLFFQAISHSGLAQSADQVNDYRHLPNIISPSPNSAALGTYAGYPVGNFTGVPAINVPLYEINEQGYKLPISLSYNASGIKVNDVASWVGLGWSLNAGGVITRNVLDRPDDVNNYVASNLVPKPSSDVGWLYNYSNDPTWAHTNYDFTTGSSTQIDSAVRHAHLYTDDLEPDIFSFNFNGHGGKFHFDKGFLPGTNSYVAPSQHQAILVPYQDLKINYAFTGASQGYDGSQTWLGSFTIVDEEGNQYVFDQPEITSTYTHTAAFLNPAAPTGISSSGVDTYSSWYLSKITTVLGKVITFNYTDEGYTNSLPIALSWRGFSIPNYPTEVSYFQTDNIMRGKRLSSIVGDDFEVYFDANLSREDLKSTNALTAIRIYSKDSQGNQSFVKEFDFNYSYLQSTTDISGDTTNGRPDLRLQLNTLLQKGSDSSLHIPPYQFTYNNAIPLPGRYSYQQDFWGYYNNNGSQTPRSTIYVYPAYQGIDRLAVFPSPNPKDQVFTFSGANRNSDPIAILSGTLSKITYPTGGWTQFTLESNQFNYRGQNLVGGGLRLKSSTDYDGINHANDIIKQYSYVQAANPAVSSGALFTMPVFAYTENFLAYWNGSDYYTNNLVADPSTIDYYNHYMVISSMPNFSMSGYDGINVGYSEIAESINGNGKTITRYSTPGKYGDLSDQPGACQVSTSGYCDGLFTATDPKYAAIHNQLVCYHGSADTAYGPDTASYVDTAGLDLAAYSYPFPPNTNYEWNRGLVVSKSVYNQAGTLLNEEDNNYALYTPQSQGPQFTYGMRQVWMTNYHLYLSSCNGALYGEGDYDAYAVYPIIGQVAKVISSKTVKTYDMVNPANDLVTTTSYSYSLNCMKPSLIQTTSSKGEAVNEHMTYALDYGLSASSDPAVEGLANLQSKHVVDPVVEQYTEKINSAGTSEGVIGGIVATYKPTLPVPDVIYRSQSPAPVMNYRRATFGTVATYDPSYQPYLSFDAYDAGGNTLQQHKLYDLNTCYIWDYQNRYPIAEVKNASLSDVAYTSFEADGGGGWGIESPGASIPDPTSPTGNNCFDMGSDLRISKNGLNTNTTYIVSYWIKSLSHTLGISNGQNYISSNIVTRGLTKNGWTYVQHKISGVTTIQFVGSDRIDELRLYPLGAQMTSYTYTPLVGMTTQCDIASRATYYEYDGFKRLKRIRDQDRNILKTFDYQYQTTQGCGANCYIIGMQTFAGSNTLSYPVGAFNINGKLLGNVTNATAYISMWNSDTADQRLGTLAVGADSMHFNLSLKSGQTMPSGVTGCRYYQYDLSYTKINAVSDLGAYVDFGDGIKMPLPLSPAGVVPPSNTKVVDSNGSTLIIHNYPDTSLKTITFYHNDDSYANPSIGEGVGDTTILVHISNLRGKFPQHMEELDLFAAEQSSASSLQSIANWNTINSLITFKAEGNGNFNTRLSPVLGQDFMLNNKNLSTIWILDLTSSLTDTLFKINRLKSDWNTYFTNLGDLVLTDRSWNNEDLSALPNLTFFLLTPYNNSNDQSITPTVIDNIINQIASGAGQRQPYGVISIFTNGASRTSASDSSYNFLISKGWQITVQP